MADMIIVLMRDGPLLFLCAMIAMFAGLAMILGHNVWSGGTLPIVVTMIGWASLAKGISLMFLSADAASGFYPGALHYREFFDWYAPERCLPAST